MPGREARVVVGRAVRVVVPGSTANLGPAYDCAGLALGVHDDVVVTAGESGGPLRVVVEGPGSEDLPQGEGPGVAEHLVVRALHAALHAWGVDDDRRPGLDLRARNGVPLGRGVGSSAAAIVTGVVAAAALLEHPPPLEEQLHVAAALEGHPDNAAASLLGGLTLGWQEGRRWRAVRLEPHPDVGVLLCVPGEALSTARARAMLPLQVDHDDAALTAGRAALLVAALTRSPELLLAATRDRLHQHHRAAAMPGASTLLEALRGAGHAAVVSGAGPSLVVLHAGDPARAAAEVGAVVAATTGVDGADGADGADSLDGADGADGADSLDGADGADGADGPRGPTGDGDAVRAGEGRGSVGWRVLAPGIARTGAVVTPVG